MPLPELVCAAFEARQPAIYTNVDLCPERVSGNVTLRDMQRVAGAHDFTWSEEELLDMINLFNANNNGRVRYHLPN